MGRPRINRFAIDARAAPPGFERPHAVVVPPFPLHLTLCQSPSFSPMDQYSPKKDQIGAVRS
jgi:hypothetical protein